MKVETYAQLLAWIDLEPSRKGHHDVELLKWLGGRAKEISLLPPTAATAGMGRGIGYGAIQLVMSEQTDDFVYWNEWDSFSGWAGICDILWAELQPHINKKVKVSKPGNGKKASKRSSSGTKPSKKPPKATRGTKR